MKRRKPGDNGVGHPAKNASIAPEVKKPDECSFCRCCVYVLTKEDHNEQLRRKTSFLRDENYGGMAPIKCKPHNKIVLFKKLELNQDSQFIVANVEIDSETGRKVTTYSWAQSILDKRMEHKIRLLREIRGRKKKEVSK